MTGDLILDYTLQETSSAYGFARSILSNKIVAGKTYTLIVCGYCSQEQIDGNGKFVTIMYSGNWTHQISISIDSIKPIVKIDKFIVSEADITNGVFVQCYSHPSTNNEGPGQSVTLLWYKVVEGEYDFDIYDAYGLNGPETNLIVLPSNWFNTETGTLSFPNAGSTTHQFWTSIPNLEIGQKYTVSIQGAIDKSNLATIFTVLNYDFSTNTQGNDLVFNVIDKPQAKVFTATKPSLLIYNGQAAATTNKQLEIYGIKVIKGDYSNIISNYTKPNAFFTPIVNNFVSLQGLCRNIPYFCGSKLLYKIDGCAQTMAEEFNTNWKDNSEGTWSIVNDPTMGDVVQYIRTSGSGNYQWSISSTYATTTLVPLTNKIVTLWMIVKDNGNLWEFSQWAAANVTLSSTTYQSKVLLGDGWYLYTRVIDTSQFNNNVAGINSIQGTVKFYSCGICEGDISPIFDLAAWNGFYYKVGEETKTENTEDWTTNSVTISKSPTTNISNTGGTVTLSATANQSRGIIISKRATFSNGTVGDWYIVSTTTDTQTISIDSLGTFTKVSGEGSILGRVVTISENKTTSIRNGTYKVVYAGKESQISISQNIGTVKYSLVLNSVSQIPASGGTATITGTYNTYWNGSSIATSSIAVNPTLTPSTTPTGWTISTNKVTATNRDIIIGTILTATGAATYGNASTSYSIQQQANNETINSIVVWPEANVITLPASGGSVIIKTTGVFSYTSGRTNVQKAVSATYSMSTTTGWTLSGQTLIAENRAVEIGNDRYCTITGNYAGHTANWTETQLGNYVTSISLTDDESFSYTNISASGGIVSPTSNLSNNPTFTFSSTSQSKSVPSSTYGTASISREYSWSNASDTFTALNTSNGALTVSSKGTTISNNTSSNSIKRVLLYTWTPKTNYNTEGIKTSGATRWATCTQLGNYVIAMTLTGGSLSYTNIAASDTSANPIINGMIVTYVFSSNATGAQPNSTYGSYSAVANYTLNIVQNGFTSVNSSGILTATNYGLLVGGARTSGIVTRTVTGTWTPSASYNAGGIISKSGILTATCTQNANIETFSSVKIVPWAESGFSDAIHPAGGRTTFYIPYMRLDYTSGAYNEFETSAGIYTITVNPSNKFYLIAHSSSTWCKAVGANTRGTNNNDSESSSELYGTITLSITYNGVTKTAERGMYQQSNNGYDSRLTLLTSSGASDYTLPAGGGSIDLVGTIYRGYPSGAERVYGTGYGNINGVSSPFTVSGLKISVPSASISIDSGLSQTIYTTYAHLQSPNFIIRRQANTIVNTTYEMDLTMPSSFPGAGGWQMPTNNSTKTYHYTSGTTSPQWISNENILASQTVGNWITIIEDDLSMYALFNNTSSIRTGTIQYSPVENPSIKVNMPISQLAGLAEFKLTYPNPNNYSSSNPLLFTKATKILCEFNGVNDAYNEIQMTMSPSVYSLQQYQSGSNKVYLVNNYGVNNTNYYVTFIRKIDNSVQGLWTKSKDSNRSVTFTVQFTVLNATYNSISYNSGSLPYSTASCTLTFNTGSTQSIVFNDKISGTIPSVSNGVPSTTYLIYSNVSIPLSSDITTVTGISMSFDGRHVSPSTGNISISSSSSGWSGGGFWRDQILSLYANTSSVNINLPSGSGPQGTVNIIGYINLN